MKALLKLSTGLILMAVLSSCEDKESDNPSPISSVVVQFKNDISIPENGGLKKVTLGFDKVSSVTGMVTVKVITNFPDDFQTDPPVVDNHIDIPIAKGINEVSFDITPVDNLVLAENKTINFELSQVSEGFTFGTKKTSVLTILDDEAPVAANFAAENGSIPENDSDGFIVYIALTTPTPEEGTITIQLSEEVNESLYATSPSFDESGKISLPVSLGANEVSFKVTPIKDPLLKGHQSLNFTITSVTGAIVKGTQLSFELVILDDELVNKPKSYESFGGGWRSKRIYEYDEKGRISNVLWETETPNLKTGTYTYFYADNGLIYKINSGADKDEIFYQENGKIIKSEKVDNGILKSYNLYDYDPAGNLGAIAEYYRQPSGEYLLSYIIINLFFNNGNIYKQLTYLPGDDPEDSDDDILISTKTFDNYSNSLNPFPMVESFPYDKLQPNLPGSHRIEENGADLLYNLSYEFNAYGLVIKRNVTGSGTEVTYYEYY